MDYTLDYTMKNAMKHKLFKTKNILTKKNILYKMKSTKSTFNNMKDTFNNMKDTFNNMKDTFNNTSNNNNNNNNNNTKSEYVARKRIRNMTRNVTKSMAENMNENTTMMGKLLILLLITILLSYNSYAASIAVTKAVMEYKDVLKGGYAEDFVYVSTDTDFDVPLEYELLGDIKTWISISPDLNDINNTIFISRNNIQELKVIIQPPQDTPIGNYTGGVRIITGTLNSPEGPYGSQLQAAFLIRINIEITGTERIECNIGGFNIPDTEIGNPLDLSMTVSNNGNVRVRPNISIDVWNQDQTKLLNSLVSDFGKIEVLPTTSKVLLTRFENNYRIGQYWAYATVYPCQKSELISFSVLEKGSIADYGDLLRIENKPWASTGEAVPITAVFKNNGERVVSAKFKGVVQLNDKIVQVLDSDFYDVAHGEVSNIQVFFTPKKLGQYTISGRVLYNNKLTYEKSSILTVNTGEEITSFNLMYVLIIIIIIIIILLLLIKIKDRKQKMNRL